MHKHLSGTLSRSGVCSATRVSVSSMLSKSVADTQEKAVAVRRKRRANGLRLYHETWKSVQETFFDTERLADWHSWEHRFDSQIRTVEGARKYANEMLRSLKDVYTELNADEDGSTARETVTTHQLLPGNIGYVRLEDFHQRTTALQLRRSLSHLKSCVALVLDLRGNLGGYTDQALDVVSLFLRRGPVVSFENRVFRSQSKRLVQVTLQSERLEKRITDAASTRIIRSKRRYRCVVRRSIPLVVLVDRNTASAAEILTAALQQNGRATVFGEATFGKGIGQTYRKMPNKSELQVTTFRVLQPNGDWAGDGHRNRPRIKPDHAVAGNGRIFRSSLKRDKQLQAALGFLDADNPSKS